MTITVKFNKPSIQAVVKMTAMPQCVPFIAKTDSRSKPNVCIRTGGDAFIFIDSEGRMTYTDACDKDWVDNNYTPCPEAHATVKIEV